MVKQTSTAHLLPIVPFSPARVQVIGITQAKPGVVTTSQPHNLQNGQEIRINVPHPCAMTQISGQEFVSIILSPTTFALYETLYPSPVPFSTINYTPFINATATLQAEMVPIGSASQQNQHAVPYFYTSTKDQLYNEGEHS
jgi:hypothetical protein